MRDSYFKACQENNHSLVRELLSRGADVNWRRDFGGRSGLHFAARGNYGELLELLLTQTGVDVNIRNSNNMTPLMVACERGHENIVRRLCQVTDIQLNSREDRGGTALHCAVARNRPACVSVLREVAGVDWNVGTDGGWYPLTLAVERGHAKVLQIILSVPQEQQDRDGTLLYQHSWGES